MDLSQPKKLLLLSSIPKLKYYRKVKDSLSLFEDKEEIIRCHGRITESFLPYDTKHPILLPRDHHITRLIVLRSHVEVMHNQSKGDLDTSDEMMILDNKAATSGQEKSLDGVPYVEGWKARLMESTCTYSLALPEVRVSDQFAFTNIGVDYADPLYVKDIS